MSDKHELQLAYLHARLRHGDGPGPIVLPDGLTPARVADWREKDVRYAELERAVGRAIRRSAKDQAHRPYGR